MSFKTFCNICFIKEHTIKLCLAENEYILNILTAFASCRDTLKGIIYLCINCCNKLEDYNKFRELFLTNFVRFRRLYNEHKKKLELSNAPDIASKLKAFVGINVERASNTPLIENYEVAHALRNDTTSNADIKYKESHVNMKTDCDELLNKKVLIHADTSFTPENNTSENENCQVKCENDSFNEDQENNRNSICVKDEPNPDLFEESQDSLAYDTVASVIPDNESANDDNSNVSFNRKNCVTRGSTDKKGSTDKEYKTLCNVCDENFSYNSDLDVHMLRNTGGEHYNCDKCNKKFSDTAKLERHKRLHNDSRPYKCTECGLRFIQIYHLNRHKLIHFPEKPFKCDECGLEFTQRYLFSTHERTHTGEKPYKCDECGFPFSRRSQTDTNLLTPTRNRTNVTIVACYLDEKTI